MTSFLGRGWGWGGGPRCYGGFGWGGGGYCGPGFGLAFAAPVGDWVVAGDAVTVLAGCDRRFATCRDKFANSINFRGFPHIPGNDFVLSYPKPGSVLNGQPLVE